MIVHYQPVIEIATQRVVRVEVLCRLPDRENGMQDPKTFIAQAEHFGLIRELTENVMKLALSERRAWAVKPPLSFNVSRLSLGDPTFYDRTIAIIRKAGAQPTDITFELNEGIQSIDDGTEFDLMRRFRDVGIRFSVDGFGPTLSIFSHLELGRVGVQEVKIAATLTAGLHGRESRASVASIVDIVKPLGVDVVAKGVETVQQLTQLRELGCGFAQGYLIAAPMDATELAFWFALRPDARENLGKSNESMGGGSSSSKSSPLSRLLFGKRA